MSMPHPRSPADLVMAPVLISVERNLALVRESEDLEFALALELDDDGSWYRTPAERARRIQRVATRDVDLHGWEANPTPDLQGLEIAHRGYSVSLMLGKRLADYVAGAAEPAR
ncbi:MAG: hypothetical protein ACLQK8_19395 [Streptosporangiaceae bacterium]|jgi:hypothetical protein